MKIQKPLSNLARIIKHSPSYQQNAPQKADTFWNVLQKSAQRLAGTLIGQKFESVSTTRRSVNRMRTPTEVAVQPTAADKLLSTTGCAHNQAKTATPTAATAVKTHATVDEKQAAASAAGVAQPQQAAAVTLQPTEKSVSKPKATIVASVPRATTISADDNRARSMQTETTARDGTASVSLKGNVNSAAKKEPQRQIAEETPVIKPTTTTATASSQSKQTPALSIVANAMTEKAETSASRIGATASPLSKQAQTEKTATRNAAAAALHKQQAQPDIAAAATKPVSASGRARPQSVSQAATQNAAPVNATASNGTSTRALPLKEKGRLQMTPVLSSTATTSSKAAIQLSEQQSARSTAAMNPTNAPAKSDLSHITVADKSVSFVAVPRSAVEPPAKAVQLSDEQSPKTQENSSTLRKIGHYWQQKLRDVRQVLTGRQAREITTATELQIETKAESVHTANSRPVVSQAHASFHKEKLQTAIKTEKTTEITNKDTEKKSFSTHTYSLSTYSLKSAAPVKTVNVTKIFENTVVTDIHNSDQKPAPAIEPVAAVRVQPKHAVESTRPTAAAPSESVRKEKSETQLSQATPSSETPRYDRTSKSATPIQRTFWGMKVLARTVEPSTEKVKAAPETPIKKDEEIASVHAKTKDAPRVIQQNVPETHKGNVNTETTRQTTPNGTTTSSVQSKTKTQLAPIAERNKTSEINTRVHASGKSTANPTESTKTANVAEQIFGRSETQSGKEAAVHNKKAPLQTEKNPFKATKQDSAEVKASTSQASLRVPPEAPLPKTPILFGAALNEHKISEQTVQMPVSQSGNKRSDDVPQIIARAEINPRDKERATAIPAQRITQPTAEKQTQVAAIAGVSNRAVDVPTMTEMSNRNADSAAQRIEPPISTISAPTVNAEPSHYTKRSSESATDAAISSKTASGETSAVQSSLKTESEATAASPTTPTTLRETIARVESAMPSQRTRFTVEQIRELQAMATRALQTAQTTADGSSQATFQWAPEGFGPLRFSIITRNDDVRIEINAGRADVIEALEEGRGNIERMIADLGMRIEKYEVRMRASDTPDPLSQPGQDRSYSERNSHAPMDKAVSSASNLIDPEPASEAVTERRLSLTEHEWVA